VLHLIDTAARRAGFDAVPTHPMAAAATEKPESKVLTPPAYSTV
jgi:hypothetical protein